MSNDDFSWIGSPHSRETYTNCLSDRMGDWERAVITQFDAKDRRATVFILDPSNNLDSGDEQNDQVVDLDGWEFEVDVAHVVPRPEDWVDPPIVPGSPRDLKFQGMSAVEPGGTRRNSGQRFQRVLREFYRWAEEPTYNGTIGRARGPDMLRRPHLVDHGHDHGYHWRHEDRLEERAEGEDARVLSGD